MNATGFIRGLRHDVRTASELAHARPAYAAGIRAAIATVTPMLAAAFLPGGGAVWMSLAGLNGSLIDRGGAYRMRAAIMTSLAVASAVTVFIGSVIGGHPVAAVIVTFIVALACGLARAWTDVGPGFGVTILVTYAIALALPSADAHGALVRAAYILAGGAWAMLLAIVLWPLRPYRPVRLRIAECYRAIARYTEAAVAELGAGQYQVRDLTSHVVAVRTAIDNARLALAISRRGRSVESQRGERLLVLHEIADQLFFHLISLLELTDTGREGLDPEQLVLSATLTEITTTIRAIAAGVESEVAVPRITVPWDGRGMRAVDPSMGEIVDRMADYAIAASELVASLNSGVPVRLSDGLVDVSDPPPEPRLFSIDAFFRPASVVLHHALRVAIVTTIAVIITSALHLNHGYWVTLTAVVILQPFAAMTRQKALQRVIGTILGGIVAAGLSAWFQGGFAILVLIAIFTMLCVALLPLNYGAYAVFGTPAFVLLAEASAGDWHLAGLRIINTLIGGTLALVGAQFLWPGEELNRLPELLATAIRANAEMLRQAIALVASGGSGLGSLRDARRAVGNAAVNAEDSFQRVMSEHRGAPDAMEPVMATLVYVRRIAASTAALAVAGQSGPATSAEHLAAFGTAADAILTDLADAAVEDRAPKTFPTMGSVAMPSPDEAPALRARVVRIARQLKLMHDAVARWKSGLPSPTYSGRPSPPPNS